MARISPALKKLIDIGDVVLSPSSPPSRSCIVASSSSGTSTAA